MGVCVSAFGIGNYTATATPLYVIRITHSQASGSTVFRGEPFLPPASGDVGVCASTFAYYNYAEPLLQWPGRLAMGVWYAAVPAVASGAGLHAIHWNFTHGLCVVQFSKSLHVLQTAEYMTWKTPTHIYEACNQHNSSCCKMEPPWQLRLDLAVAGKQVPTGQNGPKL